MLQLPGRDEALKPGSGEGPTATIQSMPDGPMADDPTPEVAESLLELRDEVIGIQAQLDEMRARIDELAQSSRPARRRLGRVRSRFTGTSNARPPNPS